MGAVPTSASVNVLGDAWLLVVLQLADCGGSACPALPHTPGAQDEAGLTHLLWFERDAAGGAAAEPEKDVVIFPGESTFSKVRAGPSQWPAGRGASRQSAADATPRHAWLTALALTLTPPGCLQIARPGSRVFELKFPEEKHRTLFFWCARSPGLLAVACAAAAAVWGVLG